MEWQQFRIDSSNKGGESCKPLEQVFHVAHLETARRILFDGRLQAGLVFDESRLNKERILVNWLSPNFWHLGSRYGNVQFGFDFSRLIEDKRFYWVEVMREYRPPACRILITDNDYSDRLEGYDAKQGDGPWWHDIETDTHWWNGRYCLELMVEQNLRLRGDCTGISFVAHHIHQCNMGGCRDKGLSRIEAACCFVARVLGEGLATRDLRLARKVKDRMEPTDELLGIFSKIILDTAEGITFDGNVLSSDDASSALAKSILLFYALQDFDSEDKIMKQYKSKDEVIDALAETFREGFQVDDKKAFLPRRRRKIG